MSTVFDDLMGVTFGEINRKVEPPPRDASARLADFDESKHPKGEGGRFVETGGKEDEAPRDVMSEHAETKGFEEANRRVADLPQEVQSEAIWQTRERYDPVEFVAQGAQRFNEEHGLPPIPDGIIDMKVDLAEAEEVATYFENAPDQSGDPVVAAAYEDFKAQSDVMFDYVTKPESEGGLGITVDFVNKTDPYNSAEEQAADVRDNHHIAIESGLGGSHGATMTTEEYDRFRAVHDIFGHVSIGGGFDRHGEYEAWLVHASMYTGPARQAMSTEYHGVNSALWAGAPGSPGTGKSVLLPEQYGDAPWQRTAAAGDDGADTDVQALIDELGLDSDWANQYEPWPWHYKDSPAQQASARQAYSDTQPRDATGKFGEGGGGGASRSELAEKLQAQEPGSRERDVTQRQLDRANVAALQSAFPSATIEITHDPRVLPGGRPTETTAGVVDAAVALAQEYPEVADDVHELRIGENNLPDGTYGMYQATGAGDARAAIILDSLQIAQQADRQSDGRMHNVGLGRAATPTEAGEAVMTHEFGHAIDFYRGGGMSAQDVFAGQSDVPGGNWAFGDNPHITNYAQTNEKEYFAEAFTANRIGFDYLLSDADKGMLRSVGVQAAAAAPSDGEIVEDFDGSIVWSRPDAAQAAVDEPESQPTPAAIKRSIDRLHKERERLGRKLLAGAEVAYAEALRRAGVKIATRTRSRGTSKTVTAQVRAALNNGTSVRPLLGALGLREQDILAGAFVTYEEQAGAWMTDYRKRQLAEILRLGLDPRDYGFVEESSEDEVRNIAAVGVISGGLMALARGRLLGGVDHIMPGEVTGGVPAKLVLDGIRVAEGRATATMGATLDDMPLVTDLPGGDTVETELAGLVEGQTEYVWVHGFYGDPTTDFDEHVRLGEEEEPFTDLVGDPRLVNDNAWPPDDYYHPNDHDGCTCEWVISSPGG